MSYATAADMIARFGSAELVRMTTPAGQDLGPLDTVAVERATAEASALIDSWLRGRYATPLVAVPLEIRAACCILARHSLAHGENREPTAQMTAARNEVMAWLRALAEGKALLADAVPATTAESGAMASDRPRAFNADSLRGW